MPVDYKRYPKNWKEIRAQILERAGNRCEGTPQFPDCRAENGQPHPLTGSKVVLTIAHMENEDPMDCRPENLRALCQKCHLTYDAQLHARHASETRRMRREEGQPLLFEVCA
jgi:hypothetical protein